ncbi:MAG: DUF192 domain-containing protein [Phycisphaerae bacterium]|nr:DUF192 domain-containing protein [Phycisphaerae bacterium]
MRFFASHLLSLSLVALASLAGCVGNPPPSSAPSGSGRASDASRRFPLDSLATGQILHEGKPIRVWLARSPQEQSEGLMFVPTDEIADDQGMLFIFPMEQQLGFWMLNTIAPLDIAYTRLDGTIVSTYQMPPRTLQTFPSIEPAIFALEMKQGAFARLGIEPGDRLEIPQSLLRAP